MVTEKLKFADRGRAIAAWYIDELGIKTNSQYLRDVANKLLDRIVERYVPITVRSSGNMNCCIEFDKISY